MYLVIGFRNFVLMRPSFAFGSLSPLVDRTMTKTNETIVETFNSPVNITRGAAWSGGICPPGNQEVGRMNPTSAMLVEKEN